MNKWSRDQASIRAAIGITLLALSSFEAQGQTPKETPPLPEPSAVISTITLQGFQRIVQAMGFDITGTKDADGKPNDYFYFQAEGHRVVVSVTDGTVVYLLNITTGKFLPTTFNDWNKEKASCCFAFLSDDGLAYLGTEVNFDGGITRAAAEARVKQYRDSVALWQRFLSDHQVQANSPEKPPAK
jgi:hypothetical protein